MSEIYEKDIVSQCCARRKVVYLNLCFMRCNVVEDMIHMNSKKYPRPSDWASSNPW